MNFIEVYTDGACSQGAFMPWPGGYGVLVVEKDKENLIISGGAEQTTNNEMELMAFLTALEHIAYFRKDKYDYVNIYTDSAYIHNCFKQKWYVKWKLNNWVSSTKEPVKNKHIWEKIINIYESIEWSIKINILKVKAHSNNEYNNLVDIIAVAEKEKHRR
jgi:ribonuclease HI